MNFSVNCVRVISVKIMILEESIPEEIIMVNREKVLEEIFELALQNDMNYFG
jgi:hypothetical protein